MIQYHNVIAWCKTYMHGMLFTKDRHAALTVLEILLAVDKLFLITKVLVQFL